MNKPESIEQEQTIEDTNVEITDLGQPEKAESSVASWLVCKLLTLQRPEYWRRFRLAGIICIPLIFILIVLLSTGNGLSFLITDNLHSVSDLHQVIKPQSASNYIPGAVPITHYLVHQQDGLACLVDAQWSPDSSLIAVLGYQHDCPKANDVPGILNLYNAYSGKLVAQWQTDDTILSILNPSPIPSGTATSSFGVATPKSVNEGENRVINFNYSNVLWSPDGHRLAITLSTMLEQQQLQGLLLMDVNGRHTQLMLQPQDKTDQLPIEWDLESGMAMPFKPVPPALGYRWGANGVLIPETLLSYDAMPPMSTPISVGNPVREDSFTIWQPGYTALTNISGLSVWSTNFGAWSPDGRYLIDGISQAGLLEPRGHHLPDAQALDQMRVANMPLLPAHDAALLQIAVTTAVVAWRPDGQILSAFNYYDTVNLYDCVTGRKITTLPLSFRNEPLAGSAALLRWSPDGRRLLLSSAWGGVIMLWGSEQLPQ